MKTKKEAINCLTSDLTNLIHEYRLETFSEEVIFSYFSNFMKSAGIDSNITIAVLEKFGDLGKEAALIIKVNEGH